MNLKIVCAEPGCPDLAAPHPAAGPDGDQLAGGVHTDRPLAPPTRSLASTHCHASAPPPRLAEFPGWLGNPANLTGYCQLVQGF